MKKKLASLLVLALVFTMLVPAFAIAAVPTDVKGTNYEEAVAKLVSLGALEGYPDGTFKPENQINRAEFAKIVAYAAGFASAAEYLGTQNTSFKDVKATGDFSWASGYIALAANKGYLKGYPDGTFKPGNPVTFAEVVTVLLRVLGYNDNLVGSWPSDYIIQADSLDLLADVKFSANAPANRGSVAILTAAALDQNMVYWDKDLQDFVEVEKNDKPVKLISKAFETSFTPAVVLKPNFVGDNKDKVSLLVNGEEKEYTASNLYILGGETLADVWGHEVEVLLDGSKIKFINSVQSTSSVVTGTLDKAVTVADNVYKATVSKKEYSFDSKAVVYFNSEKVDNASDIDFDSDIATDVKFFLNAEGKVRFAVATKYSYTNLVITDLGTLSSTNRAAITAADGNDAITLRVDADTEYYVDGKAAAYKDLAKNYVVNVIGSSTSVDKIFAYTANFNGKAEKVSTTKGTVTVAGKVYDLVGNAAVNAGNIKVDGKTEYTFYQNGNGEVAYFTTVSGASVTDFVGVLAELDKYRPVVDGRTGAEVLDLIIVDKDGKKVVVRAASTTAFDTDDLGDVFKFKYDKDGNIVAPGTDGSTLLVDYDPTDAVTVDDAKTSYFTTTAASSVKNYYGSSVVVFDLSSYDANDADADDVKAAKVADINENDKLLFYATNYYVTHVVITKSNKPSADQLTTLVGVVTDKFIEKDSNGTYYNVTLNANGETVTKAVYSGLFDGVAKFDLVAFEDTNDNDEYGQYDTLSSDIHVNKTLATLNATNKTFTLSGVSGTFLYNSNTVVYLIDLDSAGAKKAVELGVLADLADAEENGYKVSVVYGNQIATGVYEVLAIAIHYDYK